MKNHSDRKITNEVYTDLYRLTLALNLHKDGARLIPLTKKGKLLEDYNLEHTPMKDELISWFGFLEYDIGILHQKTITHVQVKYAKPNGECQKISTDKLISDMTEQVDTY